MISDYLKKASELCGSEAELARRINVKAPTIQGWKNGERPVPAKKAVLIEQITNKKVSRKHLRPGDWKEIWPELMKQKAA